MKYFLTVLTLICATSQCLAQNTPQADPTQEAAAVLKVSRPFLIKLLETGEIPYRKVGKHRCMLLSEVQEYKRRDNEKRLAVLGELAAQAQELKMGC